MTIKHGLDHLQERYKRLTVALIMMTVVALLYSSPLVEVILQVLK